MRAASWAEMAQILGEAQQNRVERVILTIGHPLAAQINTQRLIGMLDLLLTMCQGRSQRIRRERDGSWYLNLRLHYRAGLRMADAWLAGHTDQLPEGLRRILIQAKALAEEIERNHETEQAKILAIMAKLHELAVYDDPPLGTVEHGRVVHALSVLQNGRANCQGFSDAFYLLCMLCGIKTEYRTGYKGKEMHLWNGVEAEGLWLAADATANMLGTEENLGLRLADYSCMT